MADTQTLMAEGGLKTDGATVDPVSGNEVPAGSNPIEVRDTIDAKLSDGEYVIPADVVKFFGVQFFEKLREKAKSGLEDMNKDGRIGGEPVADDEESLPFSVEELQAMDDAEGMDAQMQQSGFAVGGVATADEIAAQSSTFNPASMPIGFSAFGTTPAPTTTAAQTSSKVYYNDQGLTVVIPLDANGNPTIPIPEGYSATPPQASAVPNNPDRSGDYAGKIDVGGTVSSTGTSSRLKKEDFTSPEAVKASVIKDLDSLKTAGTIGKVGGALVGGGLGSGVGGALGAGTQIAEARAKIQVAESYGWDMSDAKKQVEDAVDKMGIASRTVVNKVAPGTGLSAAYLKANPTPTPAKTTTTPAKTGSDRSDTWQGGSVSKSTAAGGAAQKNMTASQAQAQSKAAADKQGTSLATRGKARGGLMKSNKAK